MPRISETRLNTASDIRKALGRVWREVEADRMDLKKARTLIYCGATMLGVIQTADIEGRLAELEAKAEEPQ